MNGDELTITKIDLGVTAKLLRDVLEAACKKQGLSIMSPRCPGRPAANFILAQRLGIGHVFDIPAHDDHDVFEKERVEGIKAMGERGATEIRIESERTDQTLQEVLGMTPDNIERGNAAFKRAVLEAAPKPRTRYRRGV